jgi:hypothetical protein
VSALNVTVAEMAIELICAVAPGHDGPMGLVVEPAQALVTLQVPTRLPPQA